jgi:hypothetical protein
MAVSYRAKPRLKDAKAVGAVIGELVSVAAFSLFCEKIQGN